MERVIFCTGENIRVFHFKGRKPLGDLSFSSNDEKLKDFKTYLRTSAKIKTRLLVDIPEEDHKRETIAKLSGKDRTAVVKKLKAKTFRNAEYVTTHANGLDPKNKKKEKLLISSITKTSDIKLWMSILQDHQVPLLGIWSVALLAPKLAKHVPVDESHILLITQQTTDKIRQCFLSNGNLVFSREISVSKELQDISEERAFKKFILEEIEQTRTYLLNSHLITYGEKLAVCSVLSDHDKKPIILEVGKKGDLAFYNYNVFEVENKIARTDRNSLHSDFIFARLCLKQSARKHHYSTFTDRRFEIQRSMLVRLQFSGVLVVFASVIASLFFSYERIKTNKTIDVQTAALKNAESIYAKKYAPLEDKIRLANTMESAVKLSQAIRVESTVEPITAYKKIGTVLQREKYQILLVETISWKKSSGQDSDGSDMNDSSMGFESGNMFSSIEQGSHMGTELQPDLNPEPKKPVVHTLLIKGAVQISGKPYRVTVNLINDFIAELETAHAVREVEIVKLPIDLRPSSDFKEDGKKEQSSDSNEDGTFELRIKMTGESHA